MGNSWWRSDWVKTTVVGPVIAACVIAAGALCWKLLGFPTGDEPSVAPETGPAVRVVQVTHVHKRVDGTWIAPSGMGAAAVAKLNRELRATGDRNGGVPAIATERSDAIMRAAGAVESTMSTVEVVVAGNRDKPVLITAIGVRAACRDPLRGTLFWNPPQGAVDTVKLGYDLDRPEPFGQYVRPSDNDGQPSFHGDYFADHKQNLTRGEPATFRLTARTFTAYCTYRYRVSVAGAAPVTIDDHGRPFAVSAPVPPAGEDPRDGAVDCSAYQDVYAGGSYAAGAKAAELPWLPRSKTQQWC